MTDISAIGPKELTQLTTLDRSSPWIHVPIGIPQIY